MLWNTFDNEQSKVEGSYKTFCIVPYISKTNININLIISGLGSSVNVLIRDMVINEVLYEKKYDLIENSKVHIISISDDKIIDNGAITLNLKSDDKNLKLLAAEFVI